MKTLLFAVVCSLLLASLCSATSEGESATIPLFAWSGKQILPNQNEQILETITQEDIENSLNSLLGLGSKKGFISNVQGAPDAVVLFVEPKLQTDQIPHFGSAYATTTDGGSFSSLKSIIESSKSSLVAPYATAGTSFSLLAPILDRVAGKVPLVLVREEDTTLFLELSKTSDVQIISIKDLKSTNVFTSGKTSLIVVCFDKAYEAPDFAAHAIVIANVSQLVSSATSGNFVAMYTGDSAPSNLLWTFSDPNAAFYAQSQLWELDQTSNCTGNCTIHTYMTGTMLEVFMVVIALLVMLFVGICNICALQVPETYETPKPSQKQM
jgi:hypothetical protein